MSASSIPHATPLGLVPSFGFGDRLGCATPGHVAALREAGGSIRGIFAQQSIREMTRTRRTPQQVMQSATDALQAENFTGPWGADADHLKTAQDIDATADAGFVFFTIDPSDHVDQQTDGYEPAVLEEKFKAIRDITPWVAEYLGKSVMVQDGTGIEFDHVTVQRAAVKYGKAIEKAIELGRHIRRAAEQRNQPFEIELSVDETAQPTTPAEHWIIADQCARRGLKLVSLAPRFIGDLQKGIDYIGDLPVLERSLKVHAAIARQLGPYKLSLHSGSDKISMYGLFARCTDGLFHVKTAGTSYLEALRVMSLHAPQEFRRVIDFALMRYNTDKATYHVSATIEAVPAPSQVSDPKQLERIYLQSWDEVAHGRGFTAPGRQILHCTFGSVLTDPELGPLLHQVLREHAATYRQVLAVHFARHLRALRG